MSRDQKELLAQLLEEKRNRINYNRAAYMFPDQDIYDFPFNKNGYVPARSKYPKQLEFYKAGAKYIERVLIAPNSSGKTFCGMYEIYVHATGNYPSWWEGRKFNKPLTIWVCGVNNQAVRNASQSILFGSQADLGSGLIPKSEIVGTPRMKPNSNGTIETAFVRYKGQDSKLTTIVFKSYEEAVDAYSGAAVDVISLDEEPPLKIDAECTARVLRTGGIKFLTFTPDKGITDTLLHWFPNGVINTGQVSLSRYAVSFDMDDVPHLTEEEKRNFFDSLPPYLREAKYYGRPNAGVGLIYPIHRQDIEFQVTPRLPDPTWPRAYGMDPGWIKTSVVWGAYHEQSDTLYIYDEYWRGEQNYSVHSSAIKVRGDWMWGVIDKASDRNSSDAVTANTFDLYRQEGLNLILSQYGKEVESGIADVWNRFATGRLKIASHLQHIFRELNLYRKDEEGKIITGRGKDGTGHDLLDAMRYLVRNFRVIMQTKPDDFAEPKHYGYQNRNENTGY